MGFGLFEGMKTLRRRNWKRFPVEPSSLDAVLLTHAHLDHSGWLSRLVAGGFDGPIHCAAPTAEELDLKVRAGEDGETVEVP